MRETPSDQARAVYWTNTHVSRHLAAEAVAHEVALPNRKFPGHPEDFHLNIMSLESGGKIAAIFLEGIGGFVFAAEQCDARNGQGRKLLCVEAAAECAERIVATGPSRLPRR